MSFPPNSVRVFLAAFVSGAGACGTIALPLPACAPTLSAADQKRVADDEAAQVLCVETNTTREAIDACRAAVKAKRDGGTAP